MGKILKSHDEFLSNAGSFGGGGSYLKDWTKIGFADPDDPQYRCIDVWLHTIGVTQPRIYHPWRKIEKREDKDTRRISNEVWSDEVICHEEIKTYRNQYRRDDKGQRDIFPEACPSCRLIECVYQLVQFGQVRVGGQVIAQGKINWTEPLFVYEASDAEKTAVLHAAGLYNGFKDVESGTPEMADVKAAGILLTHTGRGAEAWKESVVSKLSWMFAIVDNNEVAAGIQITEESSLLGDKVQEVIVKSRSGGKKNPTDTDDLGNPYKYPFAIRWKYSSNKKLPFNKKYDAVKQDGLALTEAISKLIRSEPRDWFSYKLKETDPATFRATLQRHATEVASKILPWDWIFSGPATTSSASGEQSRPAQSAPAQQAPAPQQASVQPAPVPGRRKMPPAPPVEPERIVCGEGRDGYCDYMLLPTDAICPKCKSTYDVPAPAALIQAPAPVAAPAPVNGVQAAPNSAAQEGDPDDSQLPF